MKSVSAGKNPGSMTLVFLAYFSIMSAGGLKIASGLASDRPQNTEPSLPGNTELLQPEALVSGLKSGTATKQVIIHVGFRVLYTQAHIPDSEYTGPASTPDGVRRLRKRVEPLPRSQFIVLYCGCCPWNECPNINPAYRELRILGFNNVKVLYIAHDFGTDWVGKGYPVAKGD